MDEQQQLYPNFTNCLNCACNHFPKAMRQPVPEGVEIMVIGDSPTASEVRKGRYLEGSAADILRRTMEKVGLPTDPKKVYFTTALKCAVPKRKGKQMPSDALRNCNRHIVEHIKAVNPKIVLILGKTAAQTVYGDLKIKVTEVTGRVVPVPGVGEHITCVPILHPALISRSPAEYKPFLVSLQLAATLYKGGSAYDTGETKWQVLDTEEKCDRAIQFLATKKRVSADMETTGLDYRWVEFLVMGIGFDKNKVFVIPREMKHRVQDFFDIPDLRWIWQHGKYDKKVMWRRMLANVPLSDDIMYKHYVLDETSAHDLGYLSKAFLQAEEYKYKMNQNWKAVTLESYLQFFEALCERVAVDCDYTLQLDSVLLEELEKEPRLKNLYEKWMMPAAAWFAKIEQNGLLIDPEILKEYGMAYKKRLRDMMADIVETAAPYWDRDTYMKDMDAKSAPKDFNPGSWKQMSWMVFKKLKLKPRRKKGISTNKEVLKSIDPQHPLVEKVLAYRGVKKEYSTYVKGLLKWRDVDGRVRSDFSLHIAATGRTTSKKPNVQNLPNAFGVGNIRRAIIPPKGYIIGDSDYSGAELRWLAVLSQCPVMMDVFMTGKNLHNETAVGIWGEDYTPQDKMRAKAVNFGIPYGREKQSFVDEFGMTPVAAQAMIDGWLNKYHGARDYLQWCAEAVTKGYYLENPFGRRRRFGLVTEESLHGLQNEAKNMPIQSASSDTMVVAGIEIEPYADKYKCETVNMVHDSLLHYIPADPDIILEFGRITRDIMISLPKRMFGTEVPFASDFDIGFTWGDLVNLDLNTEIVSWEEFDPETAKKEKRKMPFREWFYKEQEKHAYKYEQDWYKQLKPLTAEPYQGGWEDILGPDDHIDDEDEEE